MKNVCFKLDEHILQDVDKLLPTSGYPTRSELLRALVLKWRNEKLTRSSLI